MIAWLLHEMDHPLVQVYNNQIHSTLKAATQWVVKFYNDEMDQKYNGPLLMEQFKCLFYNSDCSILCIVVLPHFGNLLWNIKSGLGKTGAPLLIWSKSTEYQIRNLSKDTFLKI